MIIRVIRLLSLLLDVFSYVKQTLQMAPLSEPVFEIHKFIVFILWMSQKPVMNI